MEYIVYRDTTTSFNPSGMNPYQTVSLPTFVDSAVQAHRTYYYRIASIDSSGNEGTFSMEASAIITTGVGESSTLPLQFELLQNYPNPFNPSTEITYSIPREEFVTLKVYDILGREVAVLVNEQLRAGFYTVTFNASDLPSGVYLYRLNAGTMEQTRRMLLLK